MSIAIGIVCANGVLVATDSMSSSGTVATQIDKAYALDNHPIIWAVSGSTFVGQQVEQAIEKNNRNTQEPLTPISLAGKLQPVIKDAYKVPCLPPGADARESEAHSIEALLLGWDSSGASLVHLPADLAPMECRTRRFIAIGSAHAFASASFTTLRHFVTDSLTLNQASLIAFRVISAVCEVSSWGVSLPVQIAVADSEGARVLTRSEVEKVETGALRWIESDAANFFEGSHSGLTHDEEHPPSDLPRMDHAKAV